MNIKQLLRSYWPSLIVILVIIYATWVPEPVPYEDIPSVPYIDKLIHAIMFGGLAGAIMFDYYRSNPHIHQLTVTAIIIIACIAAAFGIIDEIVQGLLGIGRPSDMMDIGANCVGVLVACFTAPPVIRALRFK